METTHRPGGKPAAVLSWLRDRRFLRRPALILSLIYLVAISAILRANVYYLDDVWRAMGGYKGWDFFSRYLSVFLSGFVHAGNYLTDVSPLPQLLAVLLMGLASAILLHALTGRRQFGVWDLIAVLPLGLCPYFLECFTYKYDAPYMALSVLASVAPLLFVGSGSLALVLSSFLGAMVMCTTYQAASGIFPMAVAALLFLRWNRGETGKELLRFLLSAAGGYLAALLIFRVFLMRYVDDYVSVAISRNGLLQNTLAHYKDYYTAILLDFKRWWLLVIALLLLLFVVTAALRSRRGAAGSALGAVLTLAVMTLLIFGVYPLLRAPLYAPRSMYGFGAYLAILAVAAVDGKLHWPPRLTCLALSWAFFVFAFTYGNALSVQDEYTKFRMSAVITDLNDLEAFSSDQEKVLQLSGSIGLAPQLRNMPQDYRMLNDLVQVTFREGWQWGEYGFYNLYDIRNVHADSDLDLRQASLPVLKDGMYHTILGDGEHFLIVLK